MRSLLRNGCRVFVLIALAYAAGVAWGTEAVTRPSEDVTLSFVRPGRIARVLVKEGDSVAAGAVVAEQDDSAETIQLRQLKAQAEDEVRVKAAEAQLALKKEESAKLDHLGKQGAVTQWDVERARLDVTIAELSLQLARFEKSQNLLKYEELKAQVERMRLVTPIAGRVEQLHVHPGESADALAKVIRIVKNDPLWVDAPVAKREADRLKVGGSAEVEFDDKAVLKGKIIHIAAVGDSASETRMVRIEAPNPASRPSGDRVQVRFPNP